MCFRKGKMRTCNKCNIEKSIDEFWFRYINKNGTPIHDRVCKKCKQIKHSSLETRKSSTEKYKNTDKYKNTLRKHTLLKYGISIEEYDEMLTRQNFVCKICSRPENKMLNGKVRRLSVDHDHETGKIRGLLCMDCNTTLGKMNDDVNLFIKMVNYLKESRL